MNSGKASMSEDINVLFGSPVAIRTFHSQTGGTSFYDPEVLFWEVLTMTIAEILRERRPTLTLQSRQYSGWVEAADHPIRNPDGKPAYRRNGKGVTYGIAGSQVFFRSISENLMRYCGRHVMSVGLLRTKSIFVQ